MKRVLCYGDSNTWGYVPGLGVRHPEDVRWTGVAAKLLGPDYRIIEEGMNGRTTAFDDPYYDFRNGKRGLGYALCAHAPLDLIVVGLGSNDLKFTDGVLVLTDENFAGCCHKFYLLCVGFLGTPWGRIAIFFPASGFTGGGDWPSPDAGRRSQ